MHRVHACHTPCGHSHHSSLFCTQSTRHHPGAFWSRMHSPIVALGVGTFFSIEQNPLICLISVCICCALLPIFNVFAAHWCMRLFLTPPAKPVLRATFQAKDHFRAVYKHGDLHSTLTHMPSFLCTHRQPSPPPIGIRPSPHNWYLYWDPDWEP